MEYTQNNSRPTHPGEVLLEVYLEPMGLTQRELADAIQVPYQRVNELVRGKRGMTPSTALRLARFLGTPAESWLELQARWDLYHAEQDEENVLAEIEPCVLAGEPGVLFGEPGAFPGEPGALAGEPGIPAGEAQVLYTSSSDRGSEIREGSVGAAMVTRIQLPPDVRAVLDRRGKKEGLSLADQVIEMVRAFLQGEVDPILQPGDPLLALPVAQGSGLGNLASDHDRYLYARDGDDRTER